LVESIYPNTNPFIVDIRSKDPSWENSIRLTLPTPGGNSKVYWAIYLKSVAAYTLILFYPAIQILLPPAIAMPSNGALNTLLLVI
jgi:hypothetical protein